MFKNGFNQNIKVVYINYLTMIRSTYLTLIVSNIAYLLFAVSPYKTSLDIKNNYKVLFFSELSLELESPDFIDISGKITNKKAVEPIFYAHAILLDINFNPIAKTTSNTAGDYFFARVPTDKLAFIRVEKEGYQSELYAIDLKTIKNRQLIINMKMIKSTVSQLPGKDLASILDNIYFDYAKSDIRPDAKIKLDKVVQVLKQYKNISIQIQSHTDSRGRNITNLKLSRKRALATFNYLISKGIKRRRLYYKGFGESKLLNKCRSGVKCSRSQHKINRRSNFKILKI